MTTLQTTKAATRRWIVLWLQGRRRKRLAADAGPMVPPAPTGASASDNAGVLIVASWDTMAAAHDGFNVYRDVDGGGFVLTWTTDPNASSVEDTDVVVAHTYSYYVTAFNAVGESAPSNVASLLLGA